MQPYLSLALHLILSHSHRVRLATHPDFKDFVIDANKRLSGKTGRDGKPLEGKLEFFDIGGSPKELMAYMVKSESRAVLVNFKSQTFQLTLRRPGTTTSLGDATER